MESIRHKLAGNSSLFPDETVRANNPRQTAASISSNGSSSRALGTKTARRVIISDDEDEDEDSSPAPDFPVPQPYHPVAGSASDPTRVLDSIHQSKGSAPGFPNAEPYPYLDAPFERPPHAASKMPPKAQSVLGNPIAASSHSARFVSDAPFQPAIEEFDLGKVDREVPFEVAVSPEEASKALKELLESSIGGADVEVDPEDKTVEGFKEGITLLPHQVQGRAWMREREKGKKRGGILADDMGLGKTIQTLVRIVEGKPMKTDRNAGYAPSTLIVCPVGLMSQWVQEIANMCENLRVISHHGPSRDRDPSRLEKAHVVVTSYATIASEWDTFAQGPTSGKKAAEKHKADESSTDSDSDGFSQALKNRKKLASTKKSSATTKAPLDALFRVKWFRVALDEAQNIKNRNAKCSKACFSLDAKYRWCLTGTPIQNNVEELYSLIHFLKVKPLDDWTNFSETISKPLKKGKSQRPMKRLHAVLSAIMLRRTKDQKIDGKPLLNLPKRSVQVVECEFDDYERAFYKSLEDRTNVTLNAFVKQNAVQNNYTSVLVLLLRLRQACDHPQLVTKDLKIDKDAIQPKSSTTPSESQPIEDTEDEELAELFGQMGIQTERKCSICQQRIEEGLPGNHCRTCERNLVQTAASEAALNSDLPLSSAKVRKILELLSEVSARSDGCEKTIIFSQFTSMLDQIEPWLRHRKIKFVRYDGSMNAIKRTEALEKLKSSKTTNVILISFKAGSTGLNLTACNNVILVDLWWNPALEDQAFDRSHRLGQTRDVNIWKLTIPDTVENRILQLQDVKRELAKAALSGDKLTTGRLKLDDLLNLFKPGHDHDD